VTGRLAAALALALAGPARAGPVLELTPPRARPGDALLVTVQGAGEAPAGDLAGQELAFYPAPGGWQAIAALPIEAGPGTLPVRVALAGAALEAPLEVVAADFPEKRLTVSSRFVKPQPPKVKRRIQADQAAFDRAFAQEPSPPLFAGRFALPREDELNARFGERRTFNRKKASRHYGLDLGGDLGAPVAATNGGRVVLVRDCWGSGQSVVLWHGGGAYSTYFHLSAFSVKEGDEVRRGQLLGKVGRSGRVTGPHLHWGVRVGKRYVDPESVLRLPFGE
jgi:murein DD-endopeptidase MepM/ murein hydrolase activator NlpD